MSSRTRRSGFRFLRNKQHSARYLSECPASLFAPAVALFWLARGAYLCANVMAFFCVNITYLTACSSLPHSGSDWLGCATNLFAERNERNLKNDVTGVILVCNKGNFIAQVSPPPIPP